MELEIKKQKGVWRVTGTINGQEVDKGFWLKSDALEYAIKETQMLQTQRRKYDRKFHHGSLLCQA